MSKQPLKIHELKIDGYQRVIEAKESNSQLHCIVAIHSTTLGPALGGARLRSYNSRDDALNDALRLAKAMTYKSAVVEDGLGGGKSVIIAPQDGKSKELLLAFGKVIDYLKGEYIVAEDVGTAPEDMEVIRQVTPYVAALPTDKSSGDPSRFTAWGVYKGIQAVAKFLWGSRTLKNRVVAIQGLGNVGSKLANILFWEGADLILSDIDQSKLHQLAVLYGADIVPSEKFCSVKCDILAPCALGGIIDKECIPTLHCKAVAGSANNQLATTMQGKMLMEKGVLYAPDYIINAGGIINAAGEFEIGGYDPKCARHKVNHIYDVLLKVFEKSKEQHLPTSQIADELAEYNMKHLIGIRKEPIIWPAHI